ncbi:hypothetical protein H1S01_14605 [Heliobacterium chlorum]|uniref:YcdB/YcdC repeated domain-containing protein n=1 Tax=Heliobacterium chlorum TaxID=2698 RepID=A0ABR7T4L6_HELCL|nr:YcdB/YcdC domain-containing protein [Heliobacterium chlorum]MBC9785720.1 hypothetical protein [Heliobacterium chlorum]
MKKSCRKWTAAGLTALMLFSAAPAVWAGMSPEQNQNETAQAKITLEQAVKKAKEAFPIPAELSRFTSRFSTQENQRSWELQWDLEDGGPHFSSMQISIDADTGDIRSMFRWKDDPRNSNLIRTPKISREQALEKAKELVQRLHPGLLAELELQPESANMTNSADALRNGQYSFEWIRKANGVPVRWNGAGVAVSAEDGSITNYHFTWLRDTIPSGTAQCTPEAAEAAFKKAQMLQLQYFITPGYARKGDQTPQVKLVYQLHHPSEGKIDAKTGQPYTPQGDTSSNGMIPFLSGTGGGPGNNALTPEEQAAKIQSEGMISREKALALVEKWVPTTKKGEIQSVLHQNPLGSKNNFIWDFSWSENNTFCNASVDAKTGELVEISRRNHFDGSEPGKLDRDGARKIADDFLRKIQPDKLKLTQYDPLAVLSEFRPDGKLSNHQTFFYNRMVNQIPFPQNGFQVEVDTVTKEITGYRCSWDQMDFPSPDGVISADEAVDAFLEYMPLKLVYDVPFRQVEKTPVLLTYAPDIKPGMGFVQMIDGRSKKPLSYDGEPVSAVGDKVFTDVTGHRAEKEIQMIGRLDMLREYKDSFHPDEPLKAVALVKALYQLRHEGWQPDEGALVRQAVSEGWLDKNLKADSTLTRMEMAKTVVRFLGLDVAARYGGIYKVPYTDADSLSPEQVGYAVLAGAMGVISSQEGAFRANDIVSRADGAVALVHLMDIKR